MDSVIDLYGKNINTHPTSLIHHYILLKKFLFIKLQNIFDVFPLHSVNTVIISVGFCLNCKNQKNSLLPLYSLKDINDIDI